MGNIVIIRRSQDIPTAKKILAQVKDCRVLVFDPVMIDLVYYEGIKEVEYFNWAECPAYADLEHECKEIAMRMEERLAEISQPFFPDCDLRGWQQLNFYYLTVSLQWYSGLWTAVLGILLGHKVHVIVCDNPLSYYFNSNIPALLLIERLQQTKIEFETYHYAETNCPAATQILDLQAELEDIQQEFLLTHLPTCVYDLLSFNKELEISQKKVLNLQAKHFDMPARAHLNMRLTDLSAVWDNLNPVIQTQLENIYHQLLPMIDQLLTLWLKLPQHRQAQVEQIAKVYQAQFCNWVLLNIFFFRSKPAKMLLSDHDADFHGPIISFAKNNNIPIMLLPHAKTIAQVDFAYENITAFTHPMQGNVILNRERAMVPNVQFIYPEEHQARAKLNRPVQKIGLMLNSISLNGVYYCEYTKYMDGIVQIIQWCQARNIDLQIRGKPSYSIVRLIAAHTGFSLNKLVECVMGPMEEFVQHCDLCLMYDTPTSGCIEFLRRGIPILNPLVHQLSLSESTFVSPNLISRKPVVNILADLEPLLLDENVFEEFRMDQFNRYTQSFAKLQRLHKYL